MRQYIYYAYAVVAMVSMQLVANELPLSDTSREKDMSSLRKKKEMLALEHENIKDIIVKFSDLSNRILEDLSSEDREKLDKCLDQDMDREKVLQEVKGLSGQAFDLWKKSIAGRNQAIIQLVRIINAEGSIRDHYNAICSTDNNKELSDDLQKLSLT